MVDTDDNTREFILNQYEKAIDNRTGSLDDDTAEEIQQEVYLKLRRDDTDWNDIKQLAEQHQDQYEIMLKDVVEFVDKLSDKNFVKSSDEDKIEQGLSKGKKMAMLTQIKAQPGQENLVYTDEPIANESRNVLVEEIHRNTMQENGKHAFIISKQHSWNGRIVLQNGRTKDQLKLTEVFANKDGERRFQHFGQTSKNKGLTKIHSHTHSFFSYEFEADNEKYLLLSDEKLEPQRCIVHGTKVSVGDYKNVWDNSGLAVDREIIFLHSYEPAIEPMTDQEVRTYRKDKDHDFLASKLFGSFRHPEWYEKMMFSILSVKDDNGYPSHFIKMAKAGTGKSSELESLGRAMDEGKPPFTGTSSTMKGLTPSFKDSPPDEGYLMRCDRVAAIDEKFNLLQNTVQNSNERMQDAFRPLLDLLEHSKREFSSGNGSITGQTDATMLAMGNPAYGLKSIYDALENEKIDEAYLSRFILYDQLESHIQFIDDRKSEFASGNDEQYLPKTDDEFVSLMDTLRMTHVKDVDNERVDEIHADLLEVVPSVFYDTFRARYKHHVINMVCGLTKYHYIVDNRETLVPQDEDYEEAREIMETVVSSWGDIDRTELSFSARINSLRNTERELFEAINDEPGITGKEVFNRVEGDELAWAMTELRKSELIAVIEEGGQKLYYPFWADEYETAKDLEEM